MFSIVIYFLSLFCSHLWNKPFSPLNWVCPFYEFSGYAGWCLSVTKGLMVFYSCDDLCDASPRARRSSWAGWGCSFSQPCSFCPWVLSTEVGKLSTGVSYTWTPFNALHCSSCSQATNESCSSLWLRFDFHITGHCISDYLNKLLFINFKLFKIFLFLNVGIYCYKFPSLWLLLYTTDLGMLCSQIFFKEKFQLLFWFLNNPVRKKKKSSLISIYFTLFKISVLVKFSIPAIEHHNQKQLGEEGFYFIL